MSHLYLLKKETDGLKVRKSFTSVPSHQLLRCPQYSDYGRLKKQATNASSVHSYKIEKVYTISLNVKFLFYIGIQCCNFLSFMFCLVFVIIEHSNTSSFTIKDAVSSRSLENVTDC